MGENKVNVSDLEKLIIALAKMPAVGYYLQKHSIIRIEEDNNIVVRPAYMWKSEA